MKSAKHVLSEQATHTRTTWNKQLRECELILQKSNLFFSNAEYIKE